MARQYRVITGDAGDDWLEKQLSKLDADGFEVVTHTSVGTPSGQIIHTVIMKREAPWTHGERKPNATYADDEARKAAADVKVDEVIRREP